MKTLIIFFAIFLLGINQDNTDKCIGIGHFTFGEPKNKYHDLILEFEEGDTQLYTTKTDELKINNVSFDFVRVTFIKNKLSAIALSTKNNTGTAFFKYLVKNYGTPTKNKNNYEWLGKKTEIIVEFYKNSKDASIDFYFKIK